MWQTWLWNSRPEGDVRRSPLGGPSPGHTPSPCLAPAGLRPFAAGVAATRSQFRARSCPQQDSDLRTRFRKAHRGSNRTICRGNWAYRAVRLRLPTTETERAGEQERRSVPAVDPGAPAEKDIVLPGKAGRWRPCHARNAGHAVDAVAGRVSRRRPAFSAVGSGSRVARPRGRWCRLRASARAVAGRPGGRRSLRDGRRRS